MDLTQDHLSLQGHHRLALCKTLVLHDLGTVGSPEITDLQYIDLVAWRMSPEYFAVHTPIIGHFPCILPQ